MEEMIDIVDIDKFNLLSVKDQERVKLFYADTIRKRNYFLPRKLVENSHINTIMCAALTLVYQEYIFHNVANGNFAFNKSIEYKDFMRVPDKNMEAATYAFFYSQNFLDSVQEEDFGYKMFCNNEEINLDSTDFCTMLVNFCVGGSILREINDITYSYAVHREKTPDEPFIPFVNTLGDSCPNFGLGQSLNSGIISLRVPGRSHTVLIMDTKGNGKVRNISEFKNENISLAPELTKTGWDNFSSKFYSMPKLNF